MDAIRKPITRVRRCAHLRIGSSISLPVRSHRTHTGLIWVWARSLYRGFLEYPQPLTGCQHGPSFAALAPPVLSGRCPGRGRDKRQYTHRREVVHAAASVWENMGRGEDGVRAQNHDASPSRSNTALARYGGHSRVPTGVEQPVSRPCIPDERGAGSSLATTLVSQGKQASPPVNPNWHPCGGGEPSPPDAIRRLPGIKPPGASRAQHAGTLLCHRGQVTTCLGPERPQVMKLTPVGTTHVLGTARCN